MSGPARLSCALGSVAALAIACTLDTLGTGLRVHFVPALVVVGAVFVVGIVHGALWDLVFDLLSRASLRVRAATWSVLALCIAGGLIVELGALARIGSAYHGLAVAILAACAIGTPLLGAVLLGMQPTQGLPRGWFAGGSRRRRVLSVGALALGAAACFVADRHLFVGLYPAAHLALQLGCWWLLMFALTCAIDRPAWLDRVRRRWLVPAGVAVLTLVLSRFGTAEYTLLELRPWVHLPMQAARHLTDVDLDGYSNLLDGGDCAPFNPRINPGVTEIPGNGIDDNCLLGDAAPDTNKTQNFAMPSAPSPMDVVLITVDSLRSDHVGAYARAYGAKGLATTPEIDAFAKHGLIFDRAYTSGGWTSIAVSSLMRGVYPRKLQWTRMFETSQFRLLRWTDREKLKPNEVITKMFPLPLTDQRPTLAEWLWRREMQTIAVVNDEFSELLSHSSGVGRGFRNYREVDTLPADQRDDAGTASLALRSIAAVPLGQRFFLWVHFFGPHSPNYVHPGVRIDGPSLEQGYDHEIRFADQQIGRLLHAIEQRQEPTAVFVTADHGEEFISGGRHHGFSLEEAAIRVPFIARVPGWKEGRVATPISLVDLMPTILRLTGTPLPTGLDGTALQDLLERKPFSRAMYADTWQYDRLGRLIRANSAAFDGRDKALFDPLQNTWLLYDGKKGKTTIRPVTARTPAALVKKLGRYVESSGGVIRLLY